MKLGNLLMIAAGGYVLWQYVLPAFVTVPQGVPEDEDELSPTPLRVPEVTASTSTLQLVKRQAHRAGHAGGSLLNAHEWNYYFQQVRGIPGPDPSVIWSDVDTVEYRMTVEEWWDGVSTHGVSGLSGFQIVPGFGRPRWA